HGEVPAGPFCLVADPVAGHARSVLHHGHTLPQEPVDQGGLAHIRPSDHRKDRRRAGYGLLVLRGGVTGKDLPVGFLQLVGVQARAQGLGALVLRGSVLPGVVGSGVCLRGLVSHERHCRWRRVAVSNATQISVLSGSAMPYLAADPSTWSLSRCWIVPMAPATARRPIPASGSAASKGSPNTTVRRVRGGGTCPDFLPVGRVPNIAAGSTGACARTASQAIPALVSFTSPRPREPSGNTPTSRSSFSSASAVCNAARPLRRSTGICPAVRIRKPMNPENISSLMIMCDSRGITPCSSGPSMMPVWLAATSSLPVRGTFSAPTTRVFQKPRARNQPTRRDQVGPHRLIASGVIVCPGDAFCSGALTAAPACGGACRRQRSRPAPCPPLRPG